MCTIFESELGVWHALHKQGWQSWSPPWREPQRELYIFIIYRILSMMRQMLLTNILRIIETRSWVVTGTKSPIFRLYTSDLTDWILHFVCNKQLEVFQRVYLVIIVFTVADTSIIKFDLFLLTLHGNMLRRNVKAANVLKRPQSTTEILLLVEFEGFYLGTKLLVHVESSRQSCIIFMHASSYKNYITFQVYTS